jgi:superfamily II DNA/RNA helicase
VLAEKLYLLKSFQRQYRAVLELSVTKTIPSLNWLNQKSDLLSIIDWNNILGIASVLAYSDEIQHLDAALRIAQAALEEQNLNEVQKNAAAVILISLTNKPAIKLAINRGYIKKDYTKSLPVGLKIDAVKCEFENSVILGDELIELNRFQKVVYQSQETSDAISISAPTSAGKSYILCNVIANRLLGDSPLEIAYIVPTRALISQVESDIRELLVKYGLKNVNICTIPQEGVDNSISNVYVFTQERLHWFLVENGGWKCDTLVIDEAHKIDDGYRGMLLQQKLEEIVESSPNVQVFFSSPFTSNPEILLENVSGRSRKVSINTKFVAVNQNLIYANQVPRKSKAWELSLCLNDGVIELGQIHLPDRPAGSELKKAAFIAHAFAAGSYGNIIYSNGSAEAERVALLLYSIVPEEDPSEEIVNLINLTKKTIHNEYRLAKVLSRSVAFHYGNMPLLIREEIERLFKLGKIKYLVCTSTLLEGVNMPAKAIYIRKPTRGKGIPLSSSDFWNLAGRAGRWGKEFSGNIICIEPSRWDIPPSPNKTKQKITRAVDTIEERAEELIGFIEGGSSRKIAEESPELEFAFGYYYNRFLVGTLNQDRDLHQKLGTIFSGIKLTIEIPEKIIQRNPGISPVAQQNLWNYFKKNLHRIEEMVPVYPEDERAYEEYVSLVGRIGKTIALYPYQLNSARAILLINWMSGKPLAVIIAKSYNKYQKKGKTDIDIHTVIRQVMDDVENFARFRFARDSSCYIDILRHFLIKNDRMDLVDEIPQLNLWLEFGVAQKTHLSFLAVGLTRNTTIELVDKYITNTQMTKIEAISWLKDQNLETLELSAIMKADIRKALGNEV